MSASTSSGLTAAECLCSAEAEGRDLFESVDDAMPGMRDKKTDAPRQRRKDDKVSAT
jgi:hypothetical protein